MYLESRLHSQKSLVCIQKSADFVVRFWGRQSFQKRVIENIFRWPTESGVVIGWGYCLQNGDVGPTSDERKRKEEEIVELGRLLLYVLTKVER